jgi:hypothetical protein
MTITTFIESEDPLIYQDFKEFQQGKWFGEFDNVKVVISRNDSYVFMVDKGNDEVYFFGLKGETLDSMSNAIQDLLSKISKELQ